MTNPEYVMVRSTVRICAGQASDQMQSVGTGFFYEVKHPSTPHTKILVLTNKHVVRNASVVKLVVSSAPSVATLDDDQQPINRQDDEVVWSLAGNLLLHPDPNIDICAIDVTVLMGQILARGCEIRSAFIDYRWLVLSSVEKLCLRDMEQVVVVGYPTGLWDNFNNMPIARVGTTATHPMARYAGRQEFLVDVAAFQGSSGSPVFGYQSPLFLQADGSYTPGTRASLLGIVWGILETKRTGELQAVEVPSALTQVPTMHSSLNLAIAHHSSAILDIEELVFPGIKRARQS